MGLATVIHGKRRGFPVWESRLKTCVAWQSSSGRLLAVGHEPSPPPLHLHQKTLHHQRFNRQWHFKKLHARVVFPVIHHLSYQWLIVSPSQSETESEKHPPPLPPIWPQEIRTNHRFPLPLQTMVLTRLAHLGRLLQTSQPHHPPSATPLLIQGSTSIGP